MPPDNDHAIVVGIDRYPMFGETINQPNDLRGPVNDAIDVAKWLQASADVSRIRLITSRGHKLLTSQNMNLITPEDGNWLAWPAGDGNIHPLKDKITQAFDEIIDEGEIRATNFQPRRIGRRLYVYMAGHGFAPSARDIALIMASARQRIQVHNLLATRWIDWFCTQAYFDEFVLWMDCCSTARVTLIPDTVPYPISAPRPGGRGRVVIASAAKFGQTAHELPLGAGGEYRGCFTFSLMRGLKGAAADQTGKITTAGLEAYLSNAFQNDLNNQPLWPKKADQEPEFLLKDQIEFADVGNSLPRYQLSLAIPDGVQVTVVTGAMQNGSYQTIATAVVAGGIITVPLAAGIYKLSAPGHSDKLFEVAAGTNSHVDLT